MDKAQVVASLASDLNETEQAIDAALVRASALLQGFVGARTALNASPVAAAASQAKAAQAIAALSAAREAMVECHEEMAKDHRRMGWGVYAAGFMDKPAEPARPGVSTEQRLRAV